LRHDAVDSGKEDDQKVVHENTPTLQIWGMGGAIRSSLGMELSEKLIVSVSRYGMYKGMHSPTGELARVCRNNLG